MSLQEDCEIEVRQQAATIAYLADLILRIDQHYNDGTFQSEIKQVKLIGKRAINTAFLLVVTAESEAS